MAGKLLVISGPSAGVGKDTIMQMFLAKHSDWQRVVTVVTRRPRQGETNGVDYHFISHEEFKQRQNADDFLETDFHAGHWYGTPKKTIESAIEKGQNLVLRIDVNGSLSIKQVMPEAILVYIDTTDKKILEKRLRARAIASGESEAQIQSRLKLAAKEAPLKNQFDTSIINPTGHPEKAVEAIEKLLGL